MINCVIKSDLFNISKRLKQIDKNYFLVRNRKTNKFEVHYKRNFNSLELVLPFNKLDARTIDYVLKTRMENRKKLLEEIERENQILLERERKENLEKAMQEFYEKGVKL